MDKTKLSTFIKDELKLDINEEIIDKFSLYEKLLLEWNEKFNLTAITKEDEILEKHFIDSIYPSKFVDFSKKGRLLDIGSGAGFPSIPLAILFPNIEFSLVESNGKKVSFLNEVRTSLKLNNVFILQSRVEDLKTLRGEFDFVTARAVTQLNILLELAIPLLKVKGHLLAYKGSMVDIEIKQSERAFHTLDSKLISKNIYKLPYSNDGRSLLDIVKNKETKNKYPRPYSIITNKPL